MANIEIKTTLDILYLSLAAASVGIAFFLCWALYYLVLGLKDARWLLHGVRRRVEMLWDVVGRGGAMFTLATRGIKELAEYARQWNENATKKTTRKKKTATEQ